MVVRWARQSPHHPHFSYDNRKAVWEEDPPTTANAHPVGPPPRRGSSICQPRGGPPAHRRGSRRSVGRRDGRHRRGCHARPAWRARGWLGAADSWCRGRPWSQRGRGRAGNGGGGVGGQHTLPRPRAAGRVPQPTPRGSPMRGREIAVGILAVPVVGRRTGAAAAPPDRPAIGPMALLCTPGRRPAGCQAVRVRDPPPPRRPLVVIPFPLTASHAVGPPAARGRGAGGCLESSVAPAAPPPLHRRRAP